MNLAKKLTKVFSLIFLAAFLVSCDSGCVAEDEFDGKFAEVKANPGASKIVGTYSDELDPVTGDVTGGQKIDWVNTGFRSNGEQFLIQITGSWAPWYGNEYTGNALSGLKRCFYDDETGKFNVCSKKSSTGNCICSRNQVSESEIFDDGVNNFVEPNCTSGDSSGDENDPAKCTCTTQSGVVTDYTTYHIPLDYSNKDESVKSADLQNPCKYDAGLGLYIGLFGRNGNDTPTRVYHLFTEDSVCDIGLNSDGKCLDDAGNDATKYIFKSANDTIFVKDDNHGNNSDDDFYGAGAQMHSPNEVVKLLIYDSYYLDNSGGYQVVFFNGVGKKDDAGLLEFLVNIVEDTVLGKVDKSTCVDIAGSNKKSCLREGGIIKSMYLSIVTDSGFITMLQVLLSLYISFYGLATLMGIAEISKKELMSRVLKVSLIMFFTSASSWSFYNEIVIGFFKSGMDYVVGIFMDLSDSNLNSETSSLLIAQVDRANDVSNSTRFSFIDLTIQKMMSLAVAKKIFGLFFGSFFGILYIPIIYALIAFFIYVMLLAASFYLINLLKLVLVLSLGPVFMCFSLFAQTNGIFKKWISFMGSRSIEVIILFIVLYNFVVLINTKFTDLLYFRTCVESWGLIPGKDNWGIPGFRLEVLVSHIDRSLVSWCADFVALGGLIFITKLVIDQIPYIAGSLITIGGDANKDAGSGAGRGQSGMNLAGKIMGDVFSVAKFGAGKTGDAAYFGSGAAIQGGTALTRRVKAGIASSSLGQSVANSTLGKAVGRVNSMLPSGPRDAYRNSLIDAEINKAKTQGAKKGLSGEKLDSYIRQETFKALQMKMHRDPKGMRSDQNVGSKPTAMKLAGVDMTSIARRLDTKLVEEPLKAFIKQEAKTLKGSKTGDVLLGSQMQDKLKERASEWAEKNLSGGRAAVEKHFNKDGMQRFIKGEAKVSTNKASKAASLNEEFGNKYLQNLKEKEFKNSQKLEKAKQGIFGGKAYQAGHLLAKNIFRTDSNNPEKAREIFLAKLAKQDRKKAYSQYISPKEREENQHKVKQANMGVRRSLRNMRDKLTGDKTLFESKKAKQMRMEKFDQDRQTYKEHKQRSMLANIKDDLTGNIVFTERKTAGKNTYDRDLKAETSSLRNSLSEYGTNLVKDKNSVSELYNKRLGAVLEKQSNLQHNKLEQEKFYNKQIEELEASRAELNKHMDAKINRASGIMSQSKKQLSKDSDSKKIESDIRRLRAEKEESSKAYEDAIRLLNLDKEKIETERVAKIKAIDDKMKTSKKGDDQRRDFLKEELNKATRKEVDARLAKLGADKKPKEELLEEAEERLKQAKAQRESEQQKLQDDIRQQRQAVTLAKAADKSAKEAALKGMLEKRRDLAAHDGLSVLTIKDKDGKEVKTTLREEEERVRYLSENILGQKVKVASDLPKDGLTQSELDRIYDMQDSKEDLNHIRGDIEKARVGGASQADLDILNQRDDSVKALYKALLNMEKIRGDENAQAIAQAQDAIDLARQRADDVKNTEAAYNIAKAAEEKLAAMEQGLENETSLAAANKKAAEIEAMIQNSEDIKPNSQSLLAQAQNADSKSEEDLFKQKQLLKSSYAIDKRSKESRAKLARMNKKVYESELEKLLSKDQAKLTAEELNKITTLKEEIAKFESEEKKYESQAKEIEGKIDDL